jgi:cobalt-zinc-cadmium efflux system membrane fusion protein
MSGDYTVRSPIDGFVVERQVNNNMMIRSDNSTGLFTISDLKNGLGNGQRVRIKYCFRENRRQCEHYDTLLPRKNIPGQIDKIMNVLIPLTK